MKFSKETIIDVIRDRWKFYLLGYLFGYAFPLIYDGVPNRYYLIPIKLMGVIFALWIGTPLYYGVKKVPVFLVAHRMIKYIVIGIAIMVVFYILQQVLLNFGVDIAPFLGFPKATK